MVDLLSGVYTEGPWTHRAVSAGGTRFHIAEAGEGPLVLLLHGFPEFWWSWHNQLVSLPSAGYRAAAIDLRGYGGSDKPPRGYDLITLAGDAAGLVRALGEANAIVAGHDWGGLLAWTMAVYHPKVVRCGCGRPYAPICAGRAGPAGGRSGFSCLRFPSGRSSGTTPRPWDACFTNGRRPAGLTGRPSGWPGRRSRSQAWRTARWNITAG
jgi:pimeloyl-ACP methyl ester carboxylesterase